MKRDACYYLDLINEKLGWSDYRIHKELGVSRGKISNHRQGRSDTFSNEFAIEVADLLGIDRMVVIADMETIRSKSTKSKRFWRGVKKNAEIACVSLTFSSYVLVSYSNDAMHLFNLAIHYAHKDKG